MFNNDNYPLGAASDSRAPWNQVDNSEVDVDVEVSITLSKVVRIRTCNYVKHYYGRDEDGFPDVDFEYDDLANDVLEQVYLPHELSSEIKQKASLPPPLMRALDDADGWKLEEISAEEV